MKKLVMIFCMLLSCVMLLCSCGSDVIGAMVNKDGHLILTLEDGSTLDAGDVSGVQGAKGATGAQGEKGDTGAAGAQGPQGIQGEKGDKGDTGAQGPQGEKGDKGEDGITPQIRINAFTYEWEISADNGATWTSTGIKATGLGGGEGGTSSRVRINAETNEWELSVDGGATWTSTGVKATGDKGEKGDTGAQGPKGDTGAQGLKGDTGAQGPKGDTGAQGPKGDTGATIEKIEFDDEGRLVITLTDGTVLDPVALPEETHQHAFGDWITLPPTCGEKGVKIRICTCGASETQEIPATGLHTYDEENTCTVCLDYKDKGVKFALVGETYTVTAYEGECPEVIIPSQYQGVAVTCIEEMAFYSCSIEKIAIPSSVKSIGAYAFDGCNALRGVYITDLAAWCNISFGNNANPLKKAGNLYLNGSEIAGDISIPAGVVSIPDYAFYYCDQITSIAFPNTLMSIGKQAFFECRSLASITIPASVTRIDGWAFANTSALETVTFENKNGWVATKTQAPYDEVNISATDLADYAKAADYLSGTYAVYDWTRTEE